MTSRLAVRERAVDRPRSLRCRKARDFFDIDITFAGFEAVVRCTHPMPLLIERINVSSAAPFVSLYWIRICLCSDILDVEFLMSTDSADCIRFRKILEELLERIYDSISLIPL